MSRPVAAADCRPADAAPVGAASRHAVLLGLHARWRCCRSISCWSTRSRRRQEYHRQPARPAAAAGAGQLLDRARPAAILPSGCSIPSRHRRPRCWLSTVLAALAAYPLSLMRWRAGPLIHALLIAPARRAADRADHPDLRDGGGCPPAQHLSRAVIVIYTGIMLPFSTFLLAASSPRSRARCWRRRASTAPARGGLLGDGAAALGYRR